jgi:hypothetical protein
LKLSDSARLWPMDSLKIYVEKYPWFLGIYSTDEMLAV